MKVPGTEACHEGTSKLYRLESPRLGNRDVVSIDESLYLKDPRVHIDNTHHPPELRPTSGQYF
jgi:hypothetical protein